MLLEFLERLGFQFDMDWDDDVAITSVTAVECSDLTQALKPFEKRLADQVRHRARRQRSVFVGGSLNGQMIGSSAWGKWIVNHLSRGKWEVYETERSNVRAFFRGYATNKRNARRGEIVERPVTARK
jgi:hypothetical protein